MRVGGRLQMTKMCVFCWLFHSNGRRETEGEKGGGGEFDDAKWEKEGGGRGGGQGRTPTPSELIPSELQPVGRRIIFPILFPILLPILFPILFPNCAQ